MRKLSFCYLAPMAVFSYMLTACSDQDYENSSLKNLTNNKVSVYPRKPLLSDEVFIIDTICLYEKLEVLKIDEKQIYYVRSFNSMMKWPCVLKVDSISLGSLNEGNYTIFYFLIDKSDYVEDSIATKEVIQFTVRK